MTPRRFSNTAWAALVLASGLAGYHLGRSTPARAAASAEALFEADRAFDRDTHARAIEGWLDWFAGDGRMFPDGRDVVQGKAAIRDLMGAFLANPDTQLRWEPVGGDIAASEDLGYTFGHSSSRRPNADGKLEEHFGKYITIWKKQSDGTWKVVLDIGNGRPRP